MKNGERISLPGLGVRLRRARNAAELTQVAVAAELGVSWMTIHRWERSGRPVPRSYLEKLCELYGKSLEWFVTVEPGDLALYGTPDGAVDEEYLERVAIAQEAYHQIVQAPLNVVVFVGKLVRIITTADFVLDIP